MSASIVRFGQIFYNWYDTQSLKPLHPMYISTVDSGNLAAHLLTLQPGLLALPGQKILGARFFDGLNDTLRVLMDAMEGSAPAKLVELQKDLESASDNPPTILAVAWLYLDKLVTSTAKIVANFNSTDADCKSKARCWAIALARQCQDAIDELTFFSPWITLPTTSNMLHYFPDIGKIPTLHEVARLELELLPAIEHRLRLDAMTEERVWHRARAPGPNQGGVGVSCQLSALSSHVDLTKVNAWASD